jgi:phage tail sheath protein FI
VPPSGHTAGVFANNDNNFGVFKAPANEQITNALAVELPLADDEQGPLNDIGINVIRSFPNQGVKIWGARTIAPPDVTAWRFVNVRRLLLFIEKSIQEGTRFAVFEPNNLTLWQQLKRLVTDFLNTQWQEGALFGDTPDKAFAVRVDETLNPPEIRALGQLIVQVTVVPTTPAEFVIFQVIQDPTGASLTESKTT